MDDSTDLQEQLATLARRARLLSVRNARWEARADVLHALATGSDELVTSLADVVQTDEKTRRQMYRTTHKRELVDSLAKWDGRSPTPAVMAQRVLEAGAQNMVRNSGHELRPTGAEIDH